MQKIANLMILTGILLFAVISLSSAVGELPQMLCMNEGETVYFSQCQSTTPIPDKTCDKDHCQTCVTYNPSTNIYCPKSFNECNDQNCIYLNSTTTNNNTVVITGIVLNPGLPLNVNSPQPIKQNISLNFGSTIFPLNVTFKLYNSNNSLILTKVVAVKNTSFLPVIYSLPTNLSNGTFRLDANFSSNQKKSSFKITLGNILVNQAGSTQLTISNVTSNPAFSIDNNGNAQPVSISFVSNLYPVNVSFDLKTITGTLVNNQKITVNSASSLPIVYNIPGDLADGTYSLNAIFTASGSVQQKSLGFISVTNTNSTEPPASEPAPSSGSSGGGGGGGGGGSSKKTTTAAQNNDTILLNPVSTDTSGSSSGGESDNTDTAANETVNQETQAGITGAVTSALNKELAGIKVTYILIIIGLAIVATVIVFVIKSK